METLRPDWKLLRYDNDKIDLSNNLCYDAVLLDQVDQLIKDSNVSLRQYPDEAVAYKILSDYYNIPMENISIGFGIGELMIRILQLPVVKKISIITPTWPMVAVYSKIYNIDHSLDYDETANVLYIANPNGVNGSIVTKQQVEEYLDKFDLVIVDEAYADFDSSQSVLEQSQFRDNLIVLKTFSKSLSLAGLRFGYAFSNSEIITDLQEKRPSGAVTNLPLAILHDLLELITPHVERMLQSKKALSECYKLLPSHGNYILTPTLPSTVLEKVKLSKVSGLGYRMALADQITLTELGIIK